MKNDLYNILNNCNNKYTVICKLGNSYSSEVYTVENNNKTYILKISYNARAYHTETAVLNLLSQLSFSSPHLIEHLDSFNSFIMTQINGTNGDAVKLDTSHIKQAVKTITDFHNIPALDSLVHYDFNFIMKTFNKNIDKISIFLETELIDFFKCYCQNQFYILKNRDFSQLIHRDMRLGNIIFSDKTDANLIDFESCAVGDPVMDLMKLYPELDGINPFLGDLLIEEYSEQQNLQKENLYRIINLYTVLDKINSLAWCYNRDRLGCDFYNSNLSYLLKKYRISS